jgi:NAD(P)-dependent dehydrogenase (short-subunit alcohol dehydrogenase family)
VLQRDAEIGGVMKRLEGKVILVAGGGGIGNQLAQRYALEGAQVVLGDNHLDRGRAVVEKIQSAGGTAVAAHLDGTDEGSIAAAIALASKQFGGLDGLHANFAFMSQAQFDGDVVNIPLEVMDRVMEVNSRGYFLCTRHAIPAMLPRGGGAILYTSSIAAHLGEPTRVAYAMSKAAGHALMRHVASKYGPDGVRANAITPSMVQHEGWAHIPPDMATELKGAAVDIALIKSRIANSGDIASLGAFLMSDEGSFITGQVISVDGGTTMRS